MKFTTAESVEQVVWQCRLADWPRAQSRAMINRLFDGFPPYSYFEAEQNNIETNVNDLSGTIIDHSARRQIWNALCVPNPLFNVTVDYGAPHQRQEWSQIITREINNCIIKSPLYLELRDNVGAGMILHGIGPSIWEDSQKWLPTEVGIEDVLIPSNTLRSFRNLPFFSVYRSYTAPQLYKFINGPRRDPAWNVEVVEQAIKWVDEQARQLIGQNWPEVWSPEKMQSRIQQDSGLYASDAVPTVDCFDFYFYDDDGKNCGWKRRMILDAWGQPGVGGLTTMTDDKKPKNINVRKNGLEFSKGHFIYDSKDRIYTDNINKIIHFQFGDVSAVPPFKYHSVRSIGILLYAVCHVQNRLKCKFTDAVFESMMQFFRVNGQNDVDRAQSVRLKDKGFLWEGVKMVTPEERWKYDRTLVESAMAMNRQTMSDISQSFSQEYEPESGEESATLTMTKVQSTAALVGSMLRRAYAYEEFRYAEICRRFCIKNSRDPEVRRVRLEILKAGVDEKALNSTRWHVQANKVIGDGNSVLQTAIANKLMEVRGAFNPDAQQDVLRLYVASLTNDYSLARGLVPEAPQTSDSSRQGLSDMGSLMQGIPIGPPKNANQLAYVQALIAGMGVKINEIDARGGMATEQEITGLETVIKAAASSLQTLAGDQMMAEQVRQLAPILNKAQSVVEGYKQRLMEQMQAQAQNNGSDNGEQAAKNQAIIIQAQTKAEASQASHAQKTAQRQISFEKQELRKDQETQANIARKNAEFAQELQADAIKQEQEALQPAK